MGDTLLKAIFINIEPFRSTLLRILRPFDIAKLLVAINCSLDDWERKRHMDVIDDIVEDNQDLTVMKKLGVTLQIFGSDLALLQQRLRDPRNYLARFGDRNSFHVFAVATGLDMDHKSTLVREFRSKDEHHLVPEDMNVGELQESFNPEVSTGILVLSKWILCAPYLSHSLSNSVPGWVPVFNSRPGVNVRAYISTFNGCNSRILHMDRMLISRVFGYECQKEILRNLSNLKTTSITINEARTETREITACLTMDYVRSILLPPLSSSEASGPRLVVVNSIYPLSSAITLPLS
jgi:hypothetical protein